MLIFKKMNSDWKLEDKFHVIMELSQAPIKDDG